MLAVRINEGLRAQLDIVAQLAGRTATDVACPVVTKG
jgi:hypothetical protein